MSAPHHVRVDDTQPIPRIAYGMPLRTWHIGDHVTDVLHVAGKPMRFVGRVIESDSYVFRVRWDGGHGVATYAHGHEPGGFRAPSEADVRDAVVDGDLLSLAADRGRVRAAGELRRLAFDHPEWGVEVRRVLNRRAQELGG